MNGGLQLAGRYAFFAALATAVNMATQWLVFLLPPDVPLLLYLAMAAGTLTGLVAKYELDRRWIFAYRPKRAQDNARRFALYSLTGVATTAVFWGTEMAFYYLWGFAGSQYLGGALGLAAGYWLKYRLDRRFVFGAQAPSGDAGAAGAAQAAP